MGLFRTEVLAERRGAWIGRATIANPGTFKSITFCAIGLSAALLVTATFGVVSRKATVHGVLAPQSGQLDIPIPQNGVIEHLSIRQGDTVQVGDLLFNVKSEKISSAGDITAVSEKSIRARRTSLLQEKELVVRGLKEKAESIRVRLQSLRGEHAQATSEVEALQQREKLAADTVRRYASLVSEGFAPTSQLQQRQEELLDVQVRLRGAMRNVATLSRELEAASSEGSANDNQAQTAIVQIERAIAALEQEAAESDGKALLSALAPRAARVAAVNIWEGQSVVAGQHALSLVPVLGSASSQDYLRAEIFAPSRYSGFVEPGQAVLIQYAPFPFQKFGLHVGTVISVSSTPISPDDLPRAQSQALRSSGQAAEPMYRVVVQIPDQFVQAYGRKIALTPGTVLQADIILESRSILEWVFDPILAHTESIKSLP